MKQGCVASLAVVLTGFCMIGCENMQLPGSSGAWSTTRRIKVDEYLDKLKGGWQRYLKRAAGSLVGLGIGAIGGAAGAGAAIGAGIGIIGGGIRRVSTGDRMYNAAYQDCMAGRVR